MEASKKLRKSRNRKEINKKRVLIPSISAAVLIILGICGAVYSSFYQSTDDAFVEGRLISIAPRVSGPVVNLFVDDNDEVQEGDLLFEIDPEPYEVILQKKKAELEVAKAHLGVVDKQVEEKHSNLSQSREDIVSATSRYDFAKKDFARYEEMYKEGIVSKQEYERALTGLTVADAGKNATHDAHRAMESALHSDKAKREATLAEIDKIKAEIAQAELNLSYTKIYAPQSGRVSARTVEKGNYLQVAQPVMSIVPKEVWVVANFKENQLTNMREGQPVKIKIDTYPSKRFKGRVQSIQYASGAKSSLFPPENAVGSYVKIVQRIPVKIVFEEDYSDFNVIPGMSVVPRVKVKG